MGSHVHNRPDLDQEIGRLPLIITGVLANTPPFVEYEGRLQMRNFIGPSRAELLEGELPAGYTISVDEDTQEIVVAWPAWEPVAQPVFNGDFERGDVGWQKGAGWQINYQPADVRITGNWAGVFRGTGQSPILCEPQPCLPGTGFAFSALFDQGPSNKKNVDCYAMAVFYDSNGNPIGSPTLGNKVHDQNNNSRHASSGNATAPPGTEKASTGALIARRKYQRPVSVDDIQWGLQGGGVGANEDATYNIVIRAFDSTGRSAEWMGSVSIRTSPTTSFTKLMLHLENAGAGGEIFDSSIYQSIGAIQNLSRQFISAAGKISGEASLAGRGNVGSGRSGTVIEGEQMRALGTGTEGGILAPSEPFVLEFARRHALNNNSLRNDGVSFNPYGNSWRDTIGLYFGTYTINLFSDTSRQSGGNLSLLINTFPNQVMVIGQVYHFAIVCIPQGVTGYNFRVFRDGVPLGTLAGSWQAAFRAGANLPTVQIGANNTEGADVNNWTSAVYDEIRLSMGTDLGWWDGFTPPTWPLPNE